MTKRLTAFLAAFLCAATCFGQAIDLGLGITSGTARVDDTILPTYQWSPADITGAVFWLPTHNTASMFAELNTGGTPPVTRPVSGGVVGILQEPIGGFLVGTGTSNQRPTLSGDATQRAWLNFPSTGQWIVSDSTKFFRFFHAARVGTILCKVKFDGANGGTANTILDNCNTTSSNSGLTIRRNTNNTILFQVCSGSNLASFSSTATVNASGDTGWHALRIWCETDGTAQAWIQIDGGTPASTNLGNAVDADCTSDLQIGMRTSGTAPMLGSIADLVITNTANVSDDDYNAWLAYNPDISGTSLERIYAAGNSLDPDEVSHLERWYDFSDASTLWQESTQSTQVSADGHSIGYVKNKKAIPTSAGAYLRDASQSTSGKRPTWQTNEQNSLAAGYWNGAGISPGFDDEHNLSVAGWRRGAQTIFVVARNDDVSTGSHLLYTNAYLGVAGSGYSNVTKNGAFQHQTGDASSTGATGTALNSGTMTNGGEGVNIIAIRMDGAVSKMWVNNVFANTALSGSGQSTNSGIFTVTNIGRPAIEGWDMNGEIFEIVRYAAPLSDATIRKVVNGLATKWAVANVPTAITTTARLDRGDWYKRLIASAYGEDHLCIAAPLPLSTRGLR